MDNVLYIGPYREFTGMGNASRKYIRSLIASGHNVSIRPIFNTFKLYPENEIEQSILDLEKNSSKIYHKCIQHCYPHQYVYNNSFDKIIGITHLESYGYKKDVAQYYDLVDEIIVGSSFVAKSLSLSGVEKPIRIVPEPIDLISLHSFRKLNPKKINKDFTFYAIGNFENRKNFLKLINAFSILSLEFDNVSLVIKTRNKPTYISNNIRESIIKDLVEIKNSVFSLLTTDKKRQPKIIVGDSEYKDILALHNSTDCYIDISSGESFGYPALEAMCFGNNLIINEKTATSELLTEDFGITVKTEDAMAEEEFKPYYCYNTIYQTWKAPILDSLINCMLAAVTESEDKKRTRISRQYERIQSYSIEKISELFKNL